MKYSALAAIASMDTVESLILVRPYRDEITEAMENANLGMKILLVQP